MIVSTLLSAPEGKTLEFKRDLSSPKPILQTLVAFANTAGGTLIIGRDDDGSIVGVDDVHVDDVHADEERLANLISDCITPAMTPDIEAVSIEKKDLLLVRVAHWPGPFYLKEKGPEDGVYVRIGSTSRQADEAMRAELERYRSNNSFDQMPCVGASSADLDDSAIRCWFADESRMVDEAAKESLGLLVHYGCTRIPSNGGIILFGKEEARNRFFPDSNISCALFQGTSKSKFLDRQELDGGLFGALEQVPRFIARNTRLAAKIESIRRQDISEYPVVAVREVLVNALAHRDYAILGMKIQVAIFSDRLEIQSPGMFPFGMTLDSFKAGVSQVRNPVVARIFHRLEIMEQWGSGWQRISEACEAGGYPEPEWQELGTCTRVIFRSHPEVRADGGEIEKAPVKMLVKTLVKTPDRILETLKEHPNLTLAEVADMIGKSVSAVERASVKLVKAGKLRYVGPQKGGRWEVLS
jgi:ATP-dependent DNA helicase RecG